MTRIISRPAGIGVRGSAPRDWKSAVGVMGAAISDDAASARA